MRSGCVGLQFLLTPTALLHALIQMLLLRANIITHQPVTLLHLLITALDHTPNDYVRLSVELIQLHPQMRRILRCIHLGGLSLRLVVD